MTSEQWGQAELARELPESATMPKNSLPPWQRVYTTRCAALTGIREWRSSVVTDEQPDEFLIMRAPKGIGVSVAHDRYMIGAVYHDQSRIVFRVTSEQMAEFEEIKRDRVLGKGLPSLWDYLRSCLK